MHTVKSKQSHLPGVEAAHVMIALHATVHNSSITLFPNTLLGDLVVNPVGEAPHGVINLAKFHRSAGVVLHSGPEFIVEIAIIKEDVGVVPPAVEVPLNRFEGLNNTFQFLVSRENDKGGVGARGLCDFGRINGHTAGGKDLVMLFTDFAISKTPRLAITTLETDGEGDTNRIEGGVPAGIRMPPGDEGCRTKRSRMKTITRQGNSKTNPRGIEMDELPFNRMRRRKKANRGEAWPFSRETSSKGRLGALGSRLVMRWMKLMGAMGTRVEDPTWPSQRDPSSRAGFKCC